MTAQKISYELVQSREDVPSLAVRIDGRRIMLHSGMYPSKEGDSLREKFDPAKYDLLIVLGTGLGYHLLPLRGILNRYRKVILVDACAGIEREISENRLTSFLAASDRVMFITGREKGGIEEIITRELELRDVSGISVVEHPVSLRIFEDYYVPVREMIQKVINRKAGSLAARRAFGVLYLTNIIRNLGHIGEHLPVKGTFGMLKGYPGVIVASGPTLELSLGALRTLQERCFIVAADSAAAVLLSRGIKPDFCVSADPQPYTREHVQGLDLTRTRRVVFLSSAPSVFAASRGFISLNTHPVSQLIEEAFPGSLGSIDSLTGSVAGDALFMGSRLGLSPAGLLGYDFSFMNYVTYSRGTAYQERYAKLFGSRLNPPESQNIDYIRRSSRGFRHQGRFSRKSFQQYRESMEDFLRRERWGPISQVSPGIPMAGVPVAGVDEFFGSLEASPRLDKEGIMERAFRAAAPLHSRIDLSLVKGYLKNIKILDEIIEASCGTIPAPRKGRIIGLIDRLP